jgi:glucan-binding YG repeat protein
MATNKELKELKDKFNKLTPSDDPNSEYQKTLSKIREEQAERTSATQSAADKLATEKDRKDAAKKIKERTRDLSTIKALENEIRRKTDLGQTPSPVFQTQLNELREKYPEVVPETPKSVKVAESVTEPTPAPTPGAPTPTPTPKSKAKSAAEAAAKAAAEKAAAEAAAKAAAEKANKPKKLTIDEIMDEVAKNYGSIDTIFKTDKGLKDLLRKAIGKDGVPNTDDDLTVDQFTRELENTDWFKTNAGPVRQRGFYKRQFDSLVAGGSDPEELYKTTEYGRGLRNTQQVIADEILRVGGNLSPEDIEVLSRDIYDLGYENQRAIVSQRIRAKISYKPGGIVGGQAGENLADLRKTAKANGLDLEKNFGDSIQGWLQKLAQGESVETFKQIIRGSAKIGLPEKVSALLDQGVDLDTVYNPYKRLMASVLEINPETISLDDSVLRSAIGPDKEMSLYDYQKMLRKDNRWQYTNQAKEEVSSVAMKVLRDFGFQG